MYPYTKEGRAAAAAAESSSSTRGSVEGSLGADEMEVRCEQKPLMLSSTHFLCCV